MTTPQKAEFPMGTLLIAKPTHPMRSYNKGDGLAMIISPPGDGSDFQSIQWLNPPSSVPYPGDNVAKQWVLTQFDVVPEADRLQYVSADLKVPETAMEGFAICCAVAAERQKAAAATKKARR